MSDLINLVDQEGNRTGSIAKLAAHEQGLLHEAFSIFIFNSQGELLLQRRAPYKYHSGGLWSNTCCSHPGVGEELQTAAHRRLQEEMGLETELKEVFSFIYQVKVSEHLTEYEFDHVFIGTSDQELVLNPEETDDYRWIDIPSLMDDIKKQPGQYTYWLREIMKKQEFVNFLSR